MPFLQYEQEQSCIIVSDTLVTWLHCLEDVAPLFVIASLLVAVCSWLVSFLRILRRQSSQVVSSLDLVQPVFDPRGWRWKSARAFSVLVEFLQIPAARQAAVRLRDMIERQAPPKIDH